MATSGRPCTDVPIRTVLVAVAPTRHKVPDVVGFPIDEAAGIVQRAGFDVSQSEAPSDSYPPGTVIGQSPGGGARAAEGSTVTLTVATAGDGGGDTGPTVPDVLGQPEGSAEAELHGAGFDVRLVYQRESDKDSAKRNKGRVWKQSPSSGSTAQRGSIVTIWVNP